jgi:hypothetical protein
MPSVTINLDKEVLIKLRDSAKEEMRDPASMLAWMIMSYTRQTTNTPSHAINPIKSTDDAGPKKFELKKAKRHIIPDDIPTRVVMDHVVVGDPAAGCTRKHDLDGVAVSFFERRVDGRWEMGVNVTTKHYDIDTGEPVATVSVDTGAGRADIGSIVLKVYNADDLISRWLAGDYEVAENWEDYVPRISRVQKGVFVREMAEVKPGRFVPSEEQLEEYRERGWSQAQVEAFIKLRSCVVPGGPEWVKTLSGLYGQVDKLGDPE